MKSGLDSRLLLPLKPHQLHVDRIQDHHSLVKSSVLKWVDNY